MLNFRNSIEEYCSSIGTDALLVQGAGGNISWKEKNTLWIKASGTWLAHAKHNSIFVPIELPAMVEAIQAQQFNYLPLTQGLRPSIETMLHALMPQKVVLHLHPVEVLAHLIREDYEETLQRLLLSSIKWVTVDYHKPGPLLAEAVYEAMKGKLEVNVVFLRNHGVVIGGETIEEVDQLLRIILVSLTGPVRAAIDIKKPDALIELTRERTYKPIKEMRLHQLAQDPLLYAQVQQAWALYPDHVVFLGSHAYCFSGIEALRDIFTDDPDLYPPVIFIQNLGVWVRSDFSLTQLEQLQCYYEVLIRQPSNEQLSNLGPTQIYELINWEAEHYRKKLEV